ncbi:sugar transferase [Ornithinimicrobium humiphilum]|uniref:Undecaprenyl-phosphate galactose phosphotransferase WbaP/exopolysaccharide biosynthesis polyprenyl glycosylphosphotransferase n=1 Tax=Ornithinimicrobium humiphilum TaxID=125288 RepID=A0A543KL26_9MICO|nr:sugar transferase [Ornithinimicrobium humiphilum]TQM95783.1 Undecaprenyl-phosphate galactose phosphotransferase WbaP/exopolysaccharide biosynthesis polyprenyl glycosylphosphotransferase [Ornithinimicrobium humiphilum]
MQHHARRYLDPYLRAVRLVDLGAVVLGVGAAQLLRFGVEERMLHSMYGTVSYLTVTIVLVVAWMLSLQLHKAYDGRLAGHGVQEYRQVFSATTSLFAILAIVAFAFKLDFARGYVLVAFPLGAVLLLVGRYLARRWLVVQRRLGRLSDRVLLVGDRDHVASLVVALRRTPDAGYNVVGACVDNARGEVEGVPVLGPESDVLVRAMEHDVDVVAVSSSAGLGQVGLRRLGWALEGRDVDLVVAPGIMDVAGPRVLTRPVQGLPLIHVEAPDFSGPHLVLKNVCDRIAALFLLVLLAPLMLVVAVCVKLEDGGPVLFRQSRVGHEGRTFSMWKFRSMVVDAEDQLPRLIGLSDASGPLFKLRSDPRVTRTGSIIRKFSLDELPQLVNVLRGEMSLVGPRPPLPREVAAYETAARRRLLVKPGMTGLWQINGRSDLSWDEAVRLDLYYVENWTPLLDVMILWRTLQVVLRPGGNGAY